MSSYAENSGIGTITRNVSIPGGTLSVKNPLTAVDLNSESYDWITGPGENPVEAKNIAASGEDFSFSEIASDIDSIASSSEDPKDADEFLNLYDAAIVKANYINYLVKA